MALTADDYLPHLQGLLPQGPAWPRDAGARLTRLLSAWADELARIDARAGALIDEADPRKADELLGDWERVAGLPDACVAAISGDQSPAARRAALVAKLSATGGQTPGYYIALAAALGYTITVTEFHARTVEDPFDYPMYGPAWNYAWQVNAPSQTLHYRTVGDSFDEPLARWGNAQLECVINRAKPAHSVVLFNYTL